MTFITRIEEEKNGIYLSKEESGRFWRALAVVGDFCYGENTKSKFQEYYEEAPLPTHPFLRKWGSGERVPNPGNRPVKVGKARCLS